MRTPVAAVLVAAALACSASGCIALTARAQVGVVTSERGSGVQAGLTLGFGIATSHEGGVVVAGGVATGQAPKLGIDDSIDYVRIPDEDAPVKIAWRAGLGTMLALRGAPSLLGPEFAALVVLRDRHSSYSDGEKWGGGGRHSVLGLGVEGRIGFATPPVTETEMTGHGVAAGGSAMLSLEWIGMSWWNP